MTDLVNHPPHYIGHPSGHECINVTRHLTFTIGSAVKYVWRWERKNGIEDLRKAQWYLIDAETNCDHVYASLADRLVVQPIIGDVLEHEHGLRFEFFAGLDEFDLERMGMAVDAMIEEAGE